MPNLTILLLVLHTIRAKYSSDSKRSNYFYYNLNTNLNYMAKIKDLEQSQTL